MTVCLFGEFTTLSKYLNDFNLQCNLVNIHSILLHVDDVIFFSSQDSFSIVLHGLHYKAFKRS